MIVICCIGLTSSVDEIEQVERVFQIFACWKKIEISIVKIHSIFALAQQVSSDSSLKKKGNKIMTQLNYFQRLMAEREVYECLARTLLVVTPINQVARFIFIPTSSPV